MTILILLALLMLALVFAVFFLLFKLIWLIFKKHTNAGPLIGAGICTLGCVLLVSVGLYKGYQIAVAPFQEMITQVKQNPAPLYGQRVYTDETYPISLDVYDGMEFSKWISFQPVHIKLGIDTNALKKDAAGKTFPSDKILMAAIVRQDYVNGNDPLADLQKIITQAESQRRIEVSSSNQTEINGLPAYQVNGEAYSNQGKFYFWLTGFFVQPDNMYYVAVVSAGNDPQQAERAKAMMQSFQVAHSLN